MEERTIIIENVSEQTIGLADTQKRLYGLKTGAKVRVSRITLQDILDFPGSKVFFSEGKVKVSNVTAKELYSMGLTEKEVKSFIKEETKIIVEEVEEKKEEVKETKIVETEKPKEIKEAVKVENKETTKAKTSTTAKSSTKKTTSKK